MGMEVRRQSRCVCCGGKLEIKEGAQAVECKFCHEVMEVTRFTQEERRLVTAIDEMNRSVNEAQQRVEDAMDEFARTGSAAAGVLQHQAEMHYEQLQQKLDQLREEYQNGQARKLSGWFVQGENAQQMRRYDEALGHYQQVLAIQNDEAEVHWRMLMCLYGVEYVRDRQSGSYLPTLTRMQVEDILQESAYVDACRYARDELVRSFYREEGKRLDGILRKYQYVSGSEKPYDVFISVKQGDDEGKVTNDAQVGLNLYYRLREQGLRVFNSAESLKHKAGEEYEPYIMHALTTAKLMVVVASCEDYLNARWLKNEWRRFRWLREKEGVQSGRRLVVYSIKQGALLSVPPEIGAIQLIDAQSNAEPVAQLCRIARDMFAKKIERAEAKKENQPIASVQSVVRPTGEDDYKQGLRLLYGKGIEIDRQKAVECFKRAAQSGHALSMYEMGMRCLTGEGIRKAPEEAVRWFLQGARQDCACAQYEYAHCCDRGIGIEEDLDAAIVWYDKALSRFAQQSENDGLAMYYLGRSLLNGEGAAVNEVQAVTWLRKSSVSGICRAQFLLGQCYAEGRGVEKNEAQAVKNFQKAAAQGYAEAQCSLGECFERGIGVTRDESEARKWYDKAAAQSCDRARIRIEKIEAAHKEAEKRAQEEALWQELQKIRKATQEKQRKEKQAMVAALIGLIEQVRLNKEKAEKFLTPEQMNERGDEFYEGRNGRTKDFNQAVHWYQKAAALGNPKAQNSLGWCYDNGDGVKKDLVEAAQWYRKAAEQGYAKGQYNLGVCYAEGSGMGRNHAEAVQWYQKAADQGYADAQNNLGVCYLHGQGVQKNEKTAVYWYKKAAAQGNNLSQYNLGICYNSGKGVAEDAAQAEYWLREAIKNGHSKAQKYLDRMKKQRQAQEKRLEEIKNTKNTQNTEEHPEVTSAEAKYLLGQRLENGDGVERNQTKAILFYLQAAAQGYAEALYRLGDMHYYGHGLNYDIEKALGYYQKAADAGHEGAKHRITLIRRNVDAQLHQSSTPLTPEQMNARGNEYYQGHVRTKDYEQAVLWYRKAAEAGNMLGQYNLGCCYDDGHGVQSDGAQAAAWYTKAANQGYTLAMRKLGDLYYYGNGVLKDYRMALGWYEKAAANGNALSKENAERCRIALRKESARPPKETVMTAEQMYKQGEAYAYGQGVPKNYEMAFKWYHQAAEQGHSLAQNGTGMCYYYGRGTQQNYAEALKWFEKSAAQGCADAQNNAAMCYYHGRGTTKNHEKAAKWLEKAAQKGHAIAQSNLGMCYYHGHGVAQDYKKALEWLKCAAVFGRADAQNNLALCYYYGRGTQQNYAEAFKWFEKASAQGHADAQNQLGMCYYYGRGTQQNYAEALKWFEKSAAQGQAEAQNNLGMCHYRGRGTAQNYEKALEWLKKSAAGGNARGQSNLAMCYYNGYGTKKSYETAVEWLKKSAAQGNAEAQYSLGICCHYGYGTAQDYNKSFDLFKKSADQGRSDAQYYVGLCYEKGLGTAQDKNKAISAYQTAEKQGSDAAAKALKRLKSGFFAKLFS